MVVVVVVAVVVIGVVVKVYIQLIYTYKCYLDGIEAKISSLVFLSASFPGSLLSFSLRLVVRKAALQRVHAHFDAVLAVERHLHLLQCIPLQDDNSG